MKKLGRMFGLTVLTGCLVVLTLTPGLTAKSTQDALKTFQAYYSELDKADNVKTYLSVEKKYACHEKMKKITESEDQLDKLGPLVMAFVKSDIHPYTSLVFGQTQIQGNTATVHYTLKGKPNFTGKSTLVYENQAWKILQTEQVHQQSDNAKMTVRF